MDKVEKPRKYKNKWLVWPNTILETMNITDCNDTINGKCILDIPIEKCIEKSEGESALGYYVKFKNGDSICAPIRTSIHPNLSPVYRMIPKDTYSELNDVEVSTFVNTDYYPFPPDHSNVIFFKDLLELKNVESGLFLGSDFLYPENNQLAHFGEGIDINVELIPSLSSAVQVTQQVPITYGTYFNIIIPGTNLSLSKVPNKSEFQWISIAEFLDDDFAFKIIPLDNSKKEGDIVSYSDKFNIVYGDISLIGVNKYTGILEVIFRNITSQRNDIDTQITFQAVSKMLGYYCDNNGECKSVPIEEITPKGLGGRYKGKMVYKQNKCFGLCKYNTDIFYSLNQTVKGGVKYVIILGLILVIFIILVMVYVRRMR